MHVSLLLTLTACTAATDFKNPADTPPATPVVDIRTPFDEALECLQPHINRNVTFAVGNINDHTGRESYADGGTGKFVTQGASEMVQSALFRAGTTLVNRRDIAIPLEEARWGIRDIKRQRPTMQYVSGSINGLDFIPGGGFSALFNGVGPRYRKNQIIISLDLYITDAATGTIVANVQLQKQLSASEIGASAGRFFGTTLVNLDAGGQDREALNFALRQMLSLATFELLAQRMNPKNYLPCRTKIDKMHGLLENTGTGRTEKIVHEELEKLRETDPEAAQILERELAGENIRDIMRDLGKPLPEEVAQTTPGAAMPPARMAGQEPSAAGMAPEPETARSSQERPALPEPGHRGASRAGPDPEPVESTATKAMLAVEFLPSELQTRLMVSADSVTPIRWGFRDGKLVIVALYETAFMLAEGADQPMPARIGTVGMKTSGNLQVLTVDLDCDCGAEGRRDPSGTVVIDIHESANRPELDLTETDTVGEPERSTA